MSEKSFFPLLTSDLALKYKYSPSLSAAPTNTQMHNAFSEECLHSHLKIFPNPLFDCGC